MGGWSSRFADAPAWGTRSRLSPSGGPSWSPNRRDTFYQAVSEIIRRSVIITLVVVAAASVALVILSRVLTRPLSAMVGTLQSIIDSGDLTTRVDVLYDDEVGRLSHTFNTMMEQLDGSYRQIKEYALNAGRWRRRTNGRFATSSRSTFPTT